MTLFLELLKAGMPALIDAINDAIAKSGKDNAVELRKRPMTVSVSFGGGEGEAIEAQRTIESRLPDDFDPDA